MCFLFQQEMRAFDKETKMLEPFIETEAMIKNLLTSLRAIIELQNPAIRERHWAELMQATQVGIFFFFQTSVYTVTNIYYEAHLHNTTLQYLIRIILIIHQLMESITVKFKFFLPISEKVHKLRGIPVMVVESLRV